jgi:hypothetical protein
MQDDFDRASDLEQHDRDEAIKHIREHQKPIESNGSCLNCYAPSTKRFCDIDCRNDYEKRHHESRLST